MIAEISPSPLVLVTGAAHRIGRAIALALAGRGFAIGLHFHTAAGQAQQTAEEIAALGRSAYLLPADLRDPQQVMAMFSEIASLPNPLTGLVNSAGIMPVSRLDDTSVDLWDDIFTLNLRAAWLCGQQTVQLMQPRPGWIINITDAGAEKTWTKYAAYILSKSALQDLTRLQARTYAPRIRVNAVAPGLILRSPEVTEEEWQHLIQRLPLRESGQPQDIARAVLFLADHPSITGQTIVVDGGYQLL